MVEVMEIQAGFKKTEVGIIPSDWEVKKVDDFSIKVGSGITPTGGERVYKKEGRPFLRSQNVGWGTLILDDIAFIDENTHNTFNSTEIQENDVFLNITGASIGRSAIANNRVLKGNVNQHVCIIRVDAKKIEPRFLNYFLLSFLGQKQISNFQAGGNRQGLNFGQIKSIQIPLPPTKAEQTAIATALNDADALITQLEKLIAKKRNIKQGAMQDLLKPKEGWEDKKLGEITLSVASGKSNTQSREGKYPIYGSTGIIGWCNVYDYEGNKILIARVGANAGTVNKVSGKYCVSDNTLMVSLQSNIDIDFIFFKLINYQLNRLVFGSGQPLITGGQLKNLEFSLPSIEEQTRIAQILSDMDAEIEALEKKLNKYKMIKQGMMQNLLSGEIRLV